MKYKKSNFNERAFIVYVIQVLSERTYKQICEFMGNITMSGVARLANAGFELVQKDEKYQKAFEEFLPKRCELV